jgi:hypothetical protein
MKISIHLIDLFFMFGLKPFLHGFISWLLFISDAVLLLLIARWFWMHWLICFLMLRHITLERYLECAPSTKLAHRPFNLSIHSETFVWNIQFSPSWSRFSKMFIWFYTAWSSKSHPDHRSFLFFRALNQWRRLLKYPQYLHLLLVCSKSYLPGNKIRNLNRSVSNFLYE